MNFSGIPRNSVGRALRLPLRLIPPSATVPVLQGPLAGMRWVVGASTHGCWLGSYEHEKVRLFRQIVRPGQIVFDVGAHVGYYTLAASRLVGRAGRVVAFEPVPRNLAYLRHHLEINEIGNVDVVESAVERSTGSAQFLEGMGSSMGRLSHDGDILVDTTTLEDACVRLAVPRVDVLKIDVEGAEVLVLAGGERILRDMHPVVFLALHGEQQRRGSLAILTRYGYTIEPIGREDLNDADEILAR